MMIKQDIKVCHFGIVVQCITTELGFLLGISALNLAGSQRRRLIPSDVGATSAAAGAGDIKLRGSAVAVRSRSLAQTVPSCACVNFHISCVGPMKHPLLLRRKKAIHQIQP